MHAQIHIDIDQFEEAFEKLQQLEALLASASGPGFAPFAALNHQFQDHLIALAADLAHEARLGLDPA